MPAKPTIAILNSSSFGKHHAEHIARLEAFAELRRVSVAPDVSASALIEELRGVQGIIASVTPKISKEVFTALPELLMIARHGIGCDNVDLDAATDAGVMVSRVDGPVERNAVAEMAVGLMLSAGRFIEAGHSAVAAGKWQDRAKYIGLELSGKTIGLIGIGNIGSRVAEILSQGFSAKVLAYDPLLDAETVKKCGAAQCEFVPLLQQSDIVSFHCPLSAETERILNAKMLGVMKRGALLVNTCRGELLDEGALIASLEEGHVAGYATDVVEGEPITGEHRLLKAPNVLVLPHLGGYTKESLKGMGDTMVSDCEAVFLRKQSPGVLANPAVIDRGLRAWQ